MSLGSVFKVFTLFFMGALFSVRRRTGKNSVLLHFADKPASLSIRKPDGSVSTESLANLVETRCGAV
jgi:hypothetical protein